ncbi:Fur family transcriptional regulator [Falsochrobactrum ovis]|uniref:Fur family transcriptional regulator n=1 Tax=Falsochrobactrum ovis TaxID=1293442 RepID=UPI000DB95B53|nr:Fur family transcriptional regulator [Falsochrobactrum ovis]
MAQLHDLTKNQTLVLNALTRVEGPASAYTLLDQLREHGFRAPLQVYRALEKLIDMGLVHRLECLNSFVACAHPQEHAHGHKHGIIAFAICENCGQVDEFSDATVEKRLKGWAHDHGFKLSKTTIELRGTCADCVAR